MSERRLLAVVGVVVFVDTTFFAVIAPLLPSLAHTLHLTRLSAGVLSASYAIGTLAGSIPGGILAVRAGPRFTVCAGLALLACSTVAFAWLHAIAALDGARVIEGLGGACSWSGGLAWIAAETPRERRGAMIGKALAAAIGGALLGPAVGALASVTGRQSLFTAFAAVVVTLIIVACRLPAPAGSSGPDFAGVRALVSTKFLSPMWLMLLPSFASGLITVLGPLRLHRLGATAVEIGGAFLLGAGAEGALAPVIGGLSDRRGRLLPLRVGLLATAVTLLSFTLPDAWVVLAVLLIATDASIGACFGPAMALLSDAADAHGLDQGLAAAQINLAWAGGQIIGSAGGGAVARVAGDGAPTIAVAVLCAVTLLVQALVAGRATRRPTVSAATPPVESVNPRR